MEIAFGILIILVCAGCAGAISVMACSMWQGGERVNAVVTSMIFFPLLAIGAIIPLRYWTTERPVIATLYADEWKCSASHVDSRIVMVGKVMVPQTYEVCDAYVRSN